MGRQSQYSILVDAELNLKDLENQLKGHKYKIDVDSSGAKSGAKNMKDASASAKELKNAGDDLSLTYQVANDVFRRSIQVISSMVEQVRELDSAITEFKKVSDLSGASLDSYVDKLTKAGQSVARTGKPNRSEPVCTDGKCA